VQDPSFKEELNALLKNKSDDRQYQARIEKLFKSNSKLNQELSEKSIDQNHRNSPLDQFQILESTRCQQLLLQMKNLVCEEQPKSNNCKSEGIIDYIVELTALDPYNSTDEWIEI
jgi:hypothetical protein